ncbi:glycosyltransferase [Marilutibacter aestuarii]|uniref:glycosyltransferase n=1 Tax=Marilutibacter aestuarii TaxID=1706195 RepID=UPI0014771625|nr:glycosyltransferase [Lysobacter aestuarii]
MLVTTSFPIKGDGSEAAGAFVSDFATELSRHVPVKVVAPAQRKIVERWSDRVDIHRYAAPDQPLSTLKPWRPRDLLSIRQVLAGGEAAVAEAVASGGVGHILALWALPSGHWARRVSAVTGVPYSVWTLGSDIWSLGRIPFVRTYLGRVLRDADGCYSDGLQLAKDTQRIAGRPVRFLPSTRRLPAPACLRERDAPPYRLLFLGRWHANKGVDILMRSLSLLSEKDWTLIHEVHIAGGGPLQAMVEAGVRTLVAAGRPVRLSGYLDRGEAASALDEADRLLIPSRVESIPVVFSDSMKSGLPVVAMPVGDLPELIGSGTGWLAENVSPGAFKHAIRASLRSSVDSSDLRRMSGMFSLENVASDLIGRTHANGRRDD